MGGVIFVAVISGMPFDQLPQQRVFDPLGMKDIGILLPLGKLKRFAACYARQHSSAAVGGLVTRATDYLQFCKMRVTAVSLMARACCRVGPSTIESDAPAPALFFGTGFPLLEPIQDEPVKGFAAAFKQPTQVRAALSAFSDPPEIAGEPGIGGVGLAALTAAQGADKAANVELETIRVRAEVLVLSVNLGRGRFVGHQVLAAFTDQQYAPWRRYVVKDRL